MNDHLAQQDSWITRAAGWALAFALGTGAVASGGAPPERGGEPPEIVWQTLGVAQGLPTEKVFSIVTDGDRVWAGTEKGLALVEEGKVSRVYGVADGLPYPVITALAMSRPGGDLWIGTMGGLARFSGGRIDAYTQLSSGLANDVVYGVACDGPVVWAATAAGLSRFDTRKGTWDIFDTSNSLMHEPWCYGVTAAQGQVYVAVWGGGVVIRDEKTGRFREHRDPDGEPEIDLFRNDGLMHDVTSTISVSGRLMWVGTYFGLSRYDGRRWGTWNQDDSPIAGNFVIFIKALGDAVWIGTDRGVSRFDSVTWQTWRRLEDPTKNEYRFTGADGKTAVMPAATGPAHNTVYGIDFAGDEVWLATAAGLSHGVPATRQSHAESRVIKQARGERQ